MKSTQSKPKKTQNKTTPASEQLPPDPDNLHLRYNEREGYGNVILEAGPRRVITVSHFALHENRKKENYGYDNLYPTIVVRETNPDGLSYKIVGVFRHAQILGPSTMEYVEENARFRKSNGDPAMLVQVTTSAIRVYTHKLDQIVHSEADYKKIGC
jgi:hypothetical protein